MRARAATTSPRPEESETPSRCSAACARLAHPRSVLRPRDLPAGSWAPCGRRPRERGPRRCRARGSPIPTPGAPARILVVDDDPLVIRLIIDTLIVEGYDVDSAENGAAALEKLRHAHFDLILSDLHMPRLDGVGLYRALAQGQDHPMTRIVFLTGSLGSSEQHRFLKETGLPLLRKPFSLAELQQIVRQALAAP
ncbi:MAG: hypothetical protein DME16_24440 [Candidatus Rokuibacteriota bacterium]|nr:MAG: hypothetical protein DME16_24440 [Candidatus Rokubacteria bacterium]